MIAPPSGSPLTQEEADLLLELARRTVREAVEGGAFPAGPENGRPFLEVRRDVFVTLRLCGDLRGCLGTWGAARTLLENLMHAARGAALEDPRFPPLGPDELHGLRIEVTLLDPPFAIDGPEQIEVGRHGISVSHRSGRGLLLPQVAIEHRLDAKEFLGLACRKAGLPFDAWRRGARIEAFSAQCVSEPDAPPGMRPDASSRRD